MSVLTYKGPARAANTRPGQLTQQVSEEVLEQGNATAMKLAVELRVPCCCVCIAPRVSIGACVLGHCCVRHRLRRYTFLKSPSVPGATASCVGYLLPSPPPYLCLSVPLGYQGIPGFYHRADWKGPLPGPCHQTVR
jgi:hypothetical protein